MLKNRILATVATILLLFTGWNVAWRYDDAVIHGRPTKVRTHLVTGRTETLTGSGWLRLSR